jgi:hypothetical protein
MIPNNLILPRDKESIISYIVSYLMKNNELAKLIQNTIKDNKLEFEMLVNVSPLIQSKIPLEYLYNIQQC